MDKASLFDVTGKVAVVTGGNDGMGRMIAQALVNNGCKVYITARTQEEGDNIAKQLTQQGPGTCLCFQASLGKEEDCYRLASQISAIEPKINILINNAGKTSARDSMSEDRKEPIWNEILSVNLNSPFYLTRAFLPLLTKAASAKDPARVINLSSISGLQVPLYDMNAYTVSKAGLNHLTRLLAKQLASSHLTVNAIAPGPFKSKRMKAEQLEIIKDSVPLGRVGEPTDIAGTILFLTSNAGSWVTGIVFPLDGGLLLGGSKL